MDPDSTTTPPTTDPQAPPPATPDTETPETPDLGDAGKKAIEAERRARKAAEKQANELAAKVKEFEDASKSESEKAAARAEAAEDRAKTAEAKALRLEIADELQVPKEFREFLTGTDEDTIRGQAEKVLTALTAATAGQRTTPRPDPTQGAKPPAGDDLDARIAEAEKRGDIPAVIALKRQKAYAPSPT